MAHAPDDSTQSHDMIGRRMPFWAAVSTSALAVVSFGVAVTTPPRSGPFAASGTAISHPYSDAARFVPRDFIWMYLALLMMLAYLVLSACLRESAAGGRGAAGTLGLSLAVSSFVVIAADYFIQLQTVQPALVRGEGADVVALTQYNPHGVFIALENLGFLAMALSFGAFALALGTSSRLERATRWLLFGASTLAVVSFVGMSIYFGTNLDYLFEVTVITIDWFTLASAGAMLAVVFARQSGG